MQSRLPVRSSSTNPDSRNSEQRESRGLKRNEGKSTIRASSTNVEKMLGLRRSKSSMSCTSTRKTPQSVLRPGGGSCIRNRSADRGRQKMKDPRPIQDKTWQTEMTIHTQEYFRNTPDGRAILNKGTSLRPMTLNMFVQLVDLVLNNLDPTFGEITLVNYIDLIPKQLMMLKYPGVVTASTLKAANTMHAWPHILAILSWLVDLAQMKERFSFEDRILNYAEDDDVIVKRNALDLKMILDSYKSWFGNEPMPEKCYEDYEMALREIMNCPKGFEQKYVAETQQLKEKLRIEQEESGKMIKKIEQANAELAENKNKKKNYQDTNEKLKAHFTKVQKETSEFRGSIKKTTEGIAQIKISELEEKIKTQTMTMQERDAYLNKTEQLKSQMQMLKKTIDNQKKLIEEKDLKSNQLRRKFEQIAHKHNISLMRPAMNYPQLNDLRLPETGFLQEEMPTKLAEIEKKMDILNTNLHKEYEELKQQRQAQQSKFQGEQNEFDNIAENRFKVENKIKNLQEYIETFNIDLEGQKLSKKIADKEESLKNLVASTPVLIEKKAELKKMKEECVIKKQAVIDKQASCLEFLRNVEKQIVGKVQGYQDIQNNITKQLNETFNKLAKQ